jgi:glycosyltransferase involved in cell wall biosynthesis
MTATPDIILRRTPLRIGIDASWACGARTGTGNYTLDLVRSLAAYPSEHEFYLYFRECCVEGNPLYRIESPRIVRRVVPSSSTLYRVLVKLGHAAREDRLDVFLSPAYFLPLFARTRRVVTFFDLNIYTLPREWFRRGRALDFLALRLLMPLSLRVADRVIAISEATRQDLVRLFPRCEGKCAVIYPGFNLARLAGAGAAPPPGGKADGNPYFLYVGVMSPTKNLERLIRAFAAFKRNDRQGVSLVLAGRECGHYMAGVLQPLIRELELGDHVRWEGFVSDERLADLYARALAVTYPSLREGFGYPILEAMHKGVPVITSAASSCAEVAGTAALCVDPLSVPALRDALSRMVEDPALRNGLRTMGLARCREFTLDRMARRHLALLEDLVHGTRTQAPGGTQPI